MLADTGYPGMKVLQFAFDGGAANEYLPHNHIKNSVVYTGTHDNDTINGWATTWLPSSVEYARRYLRLREDEGYNWGMIKAALSSPAESCVLTMQDILCLGSEARMNTPSTVGGNWQWRVRSECINTWLAGVLKEETEIYGRLPL